MNDDASQPQLRLTQCVVNYLSDFLRARSVRLPRSIISIGFFEHGIILILIRYRDLQNNTDRAELLFINDVWDFSRLRESRPVCFLWFPAP